MHRVLSGNWKPRKPGDLSFICPGLEIAWNLLKKHENLDKIQMEQNTLIKSGILRYTTF